MMNFIKVDRTDPTSTFRPDEAWIESFTKQCTDELRLKAKRYAGRRARYVGSAGGYVDDYYVRELVQDALTDTLLGVLAWDPAASPLENHVLDVIKSRTRHDRIRSKRYRRLAFDSSEGSSARGEIEGTLRLDRDSDPNAARFAEDVLAHLRGLARTDCPVLCLLDALAGGAQTKTEIMETANMSAKTYRNARDRLSRLVRSLDEETSAAVGLS